MNCLKSQELMHEWLEELLEPDEVSAIASHVAGCLPCQAEHALAKKLRGKVRAALTSPFPEITFSPPTPIQISKMEKSPTKSRTRWSAEKTFLALAASLMLLAAGSFLRNMLLERDLQSLNAKFASLSASQTALNQSLANFPRTEQDLAREYAQAVTKAREEINNQPVRLVVNGPAGVIGGAPSQFFAQAIDPNGRPLAMRMEAMLEDPRAKDKAMLLDVVPQADGTHRISVPPDAPVISGSDPILRVRALPPKEPKANTTPLPVVEVTERIKLGLPPLTTHLSTDKRLYQPGESVRFRSLTLERSTLKPPTESLKLRVRLILPNKTEKLILISDGLLTTAENPTRPITGPSGKPLRGIASGEIPLEPDQPGGEYTLKVEDSENRFVPAERKFLVQVYQKPRINKELVFSKRGYAPGEAAQMAVSATSQDGKPVTSQAVSAQLKIDEKVFDSNGVASNDQNWQSETTLNADGKATFTFKLPQEDKITRGDASITVTFTDGASVETLVKPVPLVLDRVDVALFPEGGDLVADLPARVYFTARTKTGKPTDLNARLMADGKPLVEQIRTLSDLENPGANQGLGFFEFTPKSGVYYSFELLGPSKGTKIPLPPTQSRGVSLRVDTEKLLAGGSVPVRLAATDDAMWFVGLYCRGRMLDSKLVSGKESKVELSPPPELGGVCRLTVFRVEPGNVPANGNANQGKLVPVAERLIWRPVVDNLKIDLRLESANGSGAKPGGSFTPGEKVRLKVTARDSEGKPTGAILLASVVDHSVVTLADEKNARTMPTHFLLGEEVLHPEDLEYSDFLLTGHPLAKKAMDLLLGTQGWRRFAEQDPAKFQAQRPLEANDFMVSSGLARQQATMSTQVAMEAKVRELAPVFDARFREKREEANKMRADLQTAQTEESKLNDKIKKIQGNLQSNFTPLTVGLGLASGFFSLIALLARGKSVATQIALWAVLPLLVATGSYVFLRQMDQQWAEQRNGLTFFSSSFPKKSAMMAPIAPSQAENIQLGAVGNDKFAMAKGLEKPLPMAARAVPAPLATPLPIEGAIPVAAQTGRPQMLRKGSLIAPGSASSPRPTRIANSKNAILDIRGGGFGGQSGEGLSIAGIDRLLLPESMAQDPALLAPVSGLDLPPVPVVREYSHARAFGSAASSRSDFTETLLWKPVWVLPSGEGSVEFELSDSLTRYSATIAANTEDGRLASASTLFEAKLPLALSAKLPGETTSGDLLESPLSIEGEPGATVVWQINQLEGATQQGPDKGTITLDSSGRGRTLIKIKPNEDTNTLRYQIEASSGEWKDSIQGSIPVAADGFPVTGSISLRLEGRQQRVLRLPETWQKGSLSVKLEGFPSPLGETLAGLEGMLREPHGCFEQTSSISYPNLLVLRLLKSSGHANPEIESKARDLLVQGYKRLAGFECMDTKAGFKRGFEWFGASDQQHEGLTAYGLLQFTGMREVGIEGIDPNLISRTREYLLSKRDGQGGFTRVARRLDSFGNSSANLSNAYILWALAKSGDMADLKTEINALAKRAPDMTDPYEMALAANALYLSGQKEPALSLCAKLATKQATEGHIPGAATSITHSSGDGLLIETTALAVMAWQSASKSENEANVLRAINWLSQKRAGGTFGSTQATILALEAMTQFQQANSGKTKEGTLKFGSHGQPVLNLSFPDKAVSRLVGDLKEPDSGLRPGDNPIDLELTNGNAFPGSLTWEYQTLTPPSSPKATITLQGQLDRDEVTEGESVRLNLRVQNTLPSPTGMVMAIIGLPASLALPTDAKQLIEYARQPADGTKPRIAAWEQRGRELAFYWRGFQPNEVVSLPIDLVAMVPGRTKGQAMRSYLFYSPDIKFWQNGLQITVKPKS